MRLTPEDIEARRFRLAPNGYECEAVDRFLAEVIETLRQQPAEPVEPVVTTPETDEFSRAGQEIATILRAARDSAGAMRAEAEGLAASMRSRAELEAADLLRQAEAERGQAATVLAEAQQQADATVRDAEQQIAGAVAEATARGEARATQIIEAAERQAEVIRRGERAAHQRLLAARTDLQQAIDRLAGHDDRSLLDLTVAAPHGQAGDDDLVVSAAQSNANGHAANGHAADEPAADPLLRMVRAAVGRAAQHSATLELEDEAPAV